MSVAITTEARPAPGHVPLGHVGRQPVQRGPDRDEHHGEVVELAHDRDDPGHQVDR